MDALGLLQFAAEQCGVHLFRTADGLAPIRWTDMSGAIVEIADTDLLDEARIEWDDRVENYITLRYAENYATRSAALAVGANGDFTRVVQATPDNSLACRQSVAAIAQTRPIEVDGGWLRSDTAAALALAQHVARYARPRRLVTLSLPFSFEIEPGQLIDYREAVWRALSVTNDGGWLMVSAEEVVL
jgi:hypothetical protein